METQPKLDLNSLFVDSPKVMRQAADDMNRMANYLEELRLLSVVVVASCYLCAIIYLIFLLYQRFWKHRGDETRERHHAEYSADVEDLVPKASSFSPYESVSLSVPPVMRVRSTPTRSMLPPAPPSYVVYHPASRVRHHRRHPEPFPINIDVTKDEKVKPDNETSQVVYSKVTKEQPSGTLTSSASAGDILSCDRAGCSHEGMLEVISARRMNQSRNSLPSFEQMSTLPSKDPNA